jgi:RNA polymerase sigma factor (sigma-70 family)
MSDTDLQLLARYTRQNAEDAFAELVRRHLDLVFSAALRQVRSPQLAEEVAQSAFTDLARQADRLAPDTILTAWLYQVTRRTAIDVVRREARRQLREQVACELNAMNTPAADWTHIEPLLDEAMHALDETDRAAVLLRYFENKSLREVGQTLGTNEDAARKRVSRAVERLREFFAKRGVTVGASGLVIAISANAVQAAPAGLAITISTAAALAGTTIATTATATATKAIAMTTLQKTIITATIVTAVGTGLYEARQASNLQTQVQMLQQQQAPLAEQLDQVTRERDDAKRQLAVIPDDDKRLKRDAAELLRLRGEVERLRKSSQELAKSNGADAEDPTQIETKSWLGRVNQVKQRFEQNPGSKIPELQFLLAQDWLDATKGNYLQTEDDYRKAMAGLRLQAATRFGMVAQGALSRYAEANNGQFPTDLSQLQPYFKTPADSAVLQGYQIIPAIYLGNDVSGLGDRAIIQKAASDEQVNLRVAIGAGVIVQGFRAETDGALDAAISAFAAANNGQLPKGIYDLKPFLSTPAEQAAFEKRIKPDRSQHPPSAAPVDAAFPHQYQ